MESYSKCPKGDKHAWVSSSLQDGQLYCSQCGVIRSAVHRAKPLIEKLLAQHADGCCLRFCLIDSDCENKRFDSQGKEEFTKSHCGDSTHLQLFNMLASMTQTQRLKAVRG